MEILPATKTIDTQDSRLTLSIWQASDKGAVSKSLAKRVEDAINTIPVRTLVRELGIERVRKQVEYELTQAALMLNIGGKLESFQVTMIAKSFVDDFPIESVDDFSICINKGIRGGYGKIYGLDISVIYEWMSEYLEEKAEARERALKAIAKPEPIVFEEITPETSAKIKAFQESLLNVEVRAVRPLTTKDVIAEGQQQPKKPTYCPPSLQEIQARENHRLYLSAKWKHDQHPDNHGKDNFMSKQDWIKQLQP